MKLNEMAFQLAFKKAELDRLEKDYKELAELYLKKGGQTIVLASLDKKLSVVEPKTTVFNMPAVVKYMIKQNKVKELAMSVNLVAERLTENTDKAYFQTLAKKFGKVTDGKPFVKIMSYKAA
jgi:hypothetical protein